MFSIGVWWLQKQPLEALNYFNWTRAEYVKGVVSPIQIGGQENYEIKI